MGWASPSRSEQQRVRWIAPVPAGIDEGICGHGTERRTLSRAPNSARMLSVPEGGLPNAGDYISPESGETGIAARQHLVRGFRHALLAPSLRLGSYVGFWTSHHS